MSGRRRLNWRRRHTDHVPSPTTATDYVLNCRNPECGHIWTAHGGDDAAFLCPVCGGASVVVLDTHLRYEGPDHG